MIGLSDIQYMVQWTINNERQQKSFYLNKLIRTIVQEKEKTAISRYSSNASRKVAYNKLRDALLKQICFEYHMTVDKFKSTGKKFIKWQKKHIYASVANLLTFSDKMYNYAIRVLEVMLHDQRCTTEAFNRR